MKDIAAFIAELDQPVPRGRSGKARRVIAMAARGQWGTDCGPGS